MIATGRGRPCAPVYPGPVSLDPRIGTVVAGCRIEERLRPGGMSLVYRAEHATLGRKVAIKFLDPRLSEDEDFRKRFLRESRLAAALYHPNIVPIYDAGEADQVPYITMHFVQGVDLSELLKRDGALPAGRVLTIMTQVAGALDAAHDRGLVHRDVKPANILIASGEGVEPEGHVYLTDFGLAKQVASGTALTKQGLFMGTLDYVAPEQIQGQAVDRRTDVYSLGCVVYESLAGAVPYPRDSEVAMLYAHMQEPPPPVTARRPDLPLGVDVVVARAMAKRVDDRYGTCRELIDELRTALEGAPAAEPQAVLPEAASAPGASAPAPAPEEAPAAPPFVDVASLDYRGSRYGLGRTATGYAVWDLEAGGHPVRLFPLTQEAWGLAWETFQELDASPEPEAAAAVPEEAASPAAAPIASPEPLLVGVVFLDFRGQRYALGRTQDEYAIWDLRAGGMPNRTWPIRPEAWTDAWGRYQALESAEAPVAEPAASPVPTGGPAELAGAVALDYRGGAYGLGRTSDAYAIWDLGAGGPPVQTFPLHPSTWQQAWAAFQQLESGA
jgi:tRNA A-37 threonylcarbamoyl transferase component Bud32